MQENGCTLSAHRLHICPNRGLFCARFAQPAFLCIKRRNFRRTRLSSILCVRLRPSAGWLQGSLCRRFLLPPAFRFAGAFCSSCLSFSSHARSSSFKGLVMYRMRLDFLVLRGHRRVSHADGHAVFKVQRAKRQQKSRHKTDQPCLRFFWKVMLVGYVTAESQNVQPRRARTNM